MRNYGFWAAVAALVVGLGATGCQTVGPRAAAKQAGRPPTEDSGGALRPEQAAYDVQAGELDLAIDPARKSIRGTATLTVRVLQPLTWLVFDLDPRLHVSAVRVAENGGAAAPLKFERRGPRLWIDLGAVRAPGGQLTAAIDYGGRPREAVKAPWDGGFVWAKTPSGQPWIATACETEGADLWWPCKDHPSDRPESFTLRIRVPAPLVVASNGRLVEVVANGDGTRTYHWHTDYPISNYNVALNIAPYATVTGTYRSVAGEDVPVTYWVLPENRAKGEKLFPELLQHLNFYERTIGPYPFRGEKYGVAETPHLGMEHQSIIAYGNKYRGGTYGYDWLHHHELGHEWWGNLVTAPDWSDFWIHEGLCTYMQALYAEERDGIVAYHHAIYDYWRALKNEHPVVPPAPATSQQMEESLGNEPYNKGALVVHMLRYLVGKDRMLAVLRKFAYPTDAAWHSTDGRACHYATTADFERTVREVTGQDLHWFFEVYLRRAKLPALVSKVEDGRIYLSWDVPDHLPFPMPLEVVVNGKAERIPMPDGRAVLDAATYRDAQLDPEMWIAKQRRPVTIEPVGRG